VSPVLVLSIGVAIVLLLAVGAILWTMGNSSKSSPSVIPESPTPSPEQTLTPIPTPTPTPYPTETPTAPPSPTATPTPADTTDKIIDWDISLPEIAEVRREVLKRIDLMPNLSPQIRDSLYSAVNRARGMGRLFTLSFEPVSTKISSEQIAYMKSQLERPHVKENLDDPTMVLVILGYADQQGDEQRNLQISNARAEAVRQALHDQLGIQNVMHVVAMGGTNLLDAKELAKNRIVEVWGAKP
jgi:hypothetical protein